MNELRMAFWLALDFADDVILRHRWYSVCNYVTPRLYNAEAIVNGSPSRIINGYFVDGAAVNVAADKIVANLSTLI
jgi:hypothetical protein